MARAMTSRVGVRGAGTLPLGTQMDLTLSGRFLVNAVRIHGAWEGLC